ncbi:hypothetical protein M0805_002352 [Coniferiporia weirii]|nr:hypothetical protein M0805_002352 [Coniferiporia weirii]
MLRATKSTTSRYASVLRHTNVGTSTGLLQARPQRAFSRRTGLQSTPRGESERRIKYGLQPAAQFHSTPQHQQQVLYALLATALKASGSIEFARTAARIALTFVPLVMMKNHFSRKYLKYVIKDNPDMEERRVELRRRIRQHTLFYRALIAVPFVIFGLTFIASMERTPLSGRWRVILLSPEEEDAISLQLQGTGWYRAVLEVISQDGAADIIPPSDWRYQWVQDVLRHLEGILPILAHEKSADLPWLERGPDDIPLPPPAKHPLKPRASAKEFLRYFCDQVDVSSRNTTPAPFEAPHLVPGPPYNLVLVDRPDCDNAFSFGFGPNGGGGIVVYSGFIDRVLEMGGHKACSPAGVTNGPSSSGSGIQHFLSTLFGSFYHSSTASPSSSVPPACIPTTEQTTQLAILLAHELSHLVLSHHLETLSAGTVFIPGALSMASDLIRAILFPVTMIFGPFVNDAVANLGKYGSGEVAKISELCTSMAQEFEADAVSARILAHAGFDARKTVDFWERRRAADVSECSPQRAAERAESKDLAAPLEGTMIGVAAALSTKLARRIMGATHPVHEARVLRLKSELQRWETVRAKTLRKRARLLEKERRQMNVAG